MSKKHGAYTAHALAKQGRLPDKRTGLGKAVHAIERKITEHFGGELNNLQQIELFNLMPLIVFLLKHPVTTEEGTLAADYKWAFGRIENGLRVLCELGSKKPPAKVPTIEEIIADYENETDNHKSNK